MVVNWIWNWSTWFVIVSAIEKWVSNCHAYGVHSPACQLGRVSSNVAVSQQKPCECIWKRVAERSLLYVYMYVCVCPWIYTYPWLQCGCSVWTNHTAVNTMREIQIYAFCIKLALVYIAGGKINLCHLQCCDFQIISFQPSSALSMINVWPLEIAVTYLPSSREKQWQSRHWCHN